LVKAYKVVKEVVFWLSVVGFILFVGWVYTIRDTFSIAEIHYVDGTNLKGNCGFIKQLYEREQFQISTRSCLAIQDWESVRHRLLSNQTQLVFENDTYIEINLNEVDILPPN
jgi:hypothetical protein